jgi:signal transduction histidine kinase
MTSGLDKNEPSLFWQRFLLIERGPLLRYTAATALALGSLLVVSWTRSTDGGDVSSLALTTVVLSAIYGGLGPALLDTLITSVGIDYLFAAPAFRAFDSWSSVFRIVLHGSVGVLVASIVSSLRAAYRQLRHEYLETDLARRARENVLGVVSHDLRSPLSVILMGAAQLSEGSRGGRRASDDPGTLERIHRAARQMNRIIDDLLDAVQIEKGRFRIVSAHEDLAPIIDDALESVRAAALAKDVRVNRSIRDGKLRVVCDRGRLAQVLSNLLGNAVKFSPEGGLVELLAAPDADAVRITVKDYGTGIAEEQLPHLFERYWQARDTAHHGTGLGLFIARSIVEAHGGRIEAVSQPGRGSTFTVSLPAGGASPKVSADKQHRNA